MVEPGCGFVISQPNSEPPGARSVSSRSLKTDSAKPGRVLVVWLMGRGTFSAVCLAEAFLDGLKIFMMAINAAGSKMFDAPIATSGRSSSKGDSGESTCRI